MAKLTHSTEITEKRNFGQITVEQSLDIEVDYDEKDHTFNIENVRLYENGKFVAEISKLLHKAPGSPLDTIIANIDWREIYLDWREENITPDKVPSAIFNHITNITRQDALNRLGIKL